jgi:hypothetical protein
LLHKDWFLASLLFSINNIFSMNYSLLAKYMQSTITGQCKVLSVNLLPSKQQIANNSHQRNLRLKQTFEEHLV